MDKQLQELFFATFVEAGERVKFQKSTAKLRQTLTVQLGRLFARQGTKLIRDLEKYLKAVGTLTQNDIDVILEGTSLDSSAEDLIQKVINNAVKVGAESLLTQFEFDTAVFSLKNPRATAYIQGYGAKAVTGLDNTSKLILRAILEKGVSSGWSYDKLAREIRKTFGDFTRKRAVLIATTEIGDAYQEGNLIVGKELADQGMQIEKSWLTRKDGKVDPDCIANEAQGWIDVNTAFSSGAQRPLGHPRCRCIALYRRKPK